MTSLGETLTILDKAVPALPGRVEEVAEKATALQHAAQEAFAGLQRTLADVEALGTRLQETMDTLRAHVAVHAPQVTAGPVGLRAAAEEEERAIGADGDELRGACDQTEAACGELATELAEIAHRTEAAHDDAERAVAELSLRAGASDQELEAAADVLAAAAAAGRRAFEEGGQLVTGSVTTVKDALLRLLGAAQTRLEQTARRLEEVRVGQEHTATAASESLDAGRRELQEEMRGRLDAAVQDALEPLLVSGEQALATLGQQVMALEVEAGPAREALTEELGAVAGRIPRLRDGVAKVREAAVQVGISWP